MAPDKHCPKCPNNLVMRVSEYQYIVPAMNETRFGSQAKPISDRAGIPLSAYECPNCHLIEFFHVG